MQTRFLLVRHATCARTEEVLFGRTLDAPLDADGRRQARSVAEHLRLESPLRVESSPRRRALETARAIAAAASCRLEIAASLDELDFGEWSGKSFAELEQDRAWRHWNENRDHARTPAGAGIRALQRSVGRHLAALAGPCAGATLVLVTHGEVIRSLVLHCLGAPASDYARVVIDPASVTRLAVDARGVRLEAVNESVPTPVQP
ncbi:MAG TPA: histidine phosphatase family protein [Rhodanobacteraceae bacterium]|nr:histidine phosphatase family protein [Rhodanobacteraceae bacterium]